MAKQGDWVQVRSVILQPQERAPNLPSDTQQVPLVQWVKGWLQSDADLGQPARVRTLTGREVAGTLVGEAPGYTHSVGGHFRQLQEARMGIRQALWGKDEQP